MVHLFEFQGFKNPSMWSITQVSKEHSVPKQFCKWRPRWHHRQIRSTPANHPWRDSRSYSVHIQIVQSHCSILQVALLVAQNQTPLTAGPVRLINVSLKRWFLLITSCSYVCDIPPSCEDDLETKQKVLPRLPASSTEAHQICRGRNFEALAALGEKL